MDVPAGDGIVSRHSAVAIQRDAIAACLLFYRNFTNPGPNSFLTGHFWSLSIEEQFYLLWPSIPLFLGFRRARYFALVAAVTVAALRFHSWSVLMTLTAAATFQTQYRADALLVGCATALSVPLLSKIVRGWMMMPLCVLLVLCISKYSLLIPLWESILTALLLVSTSIYSESVIGRVLGWKPLAYVGALSYSLYLWQQPFLCTPIDGAASAAGRLVAVAAISMLTHHCIEKPAIRLGHRVSARPQERNVPIA